MNKTKLIECLPAGSYMLNTKIKRENNNDGINK